MPILDKELHPGFDSPQEAPLDAVELDRDNEFGKDVLACFFPGGAGDRGIFDLVTQQPYIFVDDGNGFAERGSPPNNLYIDGLQPVFIDIPAVSDPDNNFTLLTICTFFSFTNTDVRHIVSFDRDPTTEDRLSIGLNNVNSNLKIASDGVTPGSGTAIVANRRYAFAMPLDTAASANGDIDIYIDGLLDYSVSATGALNADAYRRFCIGCGWEADTSTWKTATQDMNIEFGVLLKGKYNETQIANLLAAPYQVLKPAVDIEDFYVVEAGVTTITPDEGDITLNGQDVIVAAETLIEPDNGDITLNGQDVVVDTALDVDDGAVSLTGFNVTIETTLGPNIGSISLAGEDVDLILETALSPDKGDIILQGQQVTITAVGLDVAEARRMIVKSIRSPTRRITRRIRG